MSLRESFRLGVAWISAALATASLSAQTPEFTFRVDVSLVSLDVKVLDARQRPITSLTARDFIVVEDGVEQEIRAFSSINTPNNIILLFDRSGSTQGQWPFMQRAADRFIRNLRPQDHVALAAFDEGVTMLAGWSESRSAAQGATKQLTERGPGGGTNLYQSLERVTRREFRSMNGRRAVVVLTDGQDNQLFNPRRGARDDAAFQRTLTSVQAARTPVYFVALDTDKNPGSGTFASQTMLKEARTRMELLAGVSGGAVFFPKGMRDIVGIYDQVSQDLGSSYTIAYTSSKPSVPGQTHRIEVRVHGASVKQSRDAYVTP